MKKLFILSAAVLALAACSNEDFINGNEGEKIEKGEMISFGSFTKGTSRADHTGADAAALLGKNFVVAGTKGSTTPTTFVYDQYNVNWVENTASTTLSNTSNWEYVGYDPAKTTSLPTGAVQSIKYWDYAADQYDFAAYSLGTAKPKNVTASAIAVGNKSYTLTGKATDLVKCYISDLVTAYNADDDFGKEVTFKFRSLGTKVRVGFYETIPGYSVKDVMFYTDATGTTPAAKPTLYADDKVLPAGEGVMTVTFPTVGSAKKTATDYNKAHVTFTQKEGVAKASTVEMSNELTYVGREKVEAKDKVYLGRTSATASYSGATYDIVLPNEEGATLNLRVKYTLVSTDGSGEEITVDNATAVVPQALTKWMPNYAYTYIFKISDNTNGYTNPELGPAGLYPITFDAVVIDTEDGVQETITNVAPTSITTYQKGKVVTANDEYVAGNIYVAVGNAVELTSANAKLYTAVASTTSIQGITEETVANCLAHGTKSGTTWTVTDAKTGTLALTSSDALTVGLSAIPAADAPNGNELAINCGKITAVAGKTYVFEFINDDAVDATYDEGTVLATDASLEGYYTKEDTYTLCGTGATAVAGTDYYSKLGDVYTKVTVADGDDVSTYYTLTATTYTPCEATGTADGTTKYYQQQTPFIPATKSYKVIKVKN